MHTIEDLILLYPILIAKAAVSQMSRKKKSQGDLKKKFSREDWNAAEVKLDEHTLTVLTCLKEYASDRKYAVKKFPVMGEKFYNIIRDKLREFKGGCLVEDLVISDTKRQETANKKRNPKKKGLTSEEIKSNHAADKVMTQIVTLLDSFDSKTMHYETGLKSKYMEMRGITFMYCAWYILSQRERYQHHLPEVYELIVGIQKFVKATTDYEGNSILNESLPLEISQTMITDLQKWLQKLLHVYPFDGLVVYNVTPKLIHHTKYDDGIPLIKVAPRQNQIDIITMIKDNIKDGFLILYKAMIASGKTTAAAVCIPTIIHDINVQVRSTTKTTNMMKRYELIACCNLESVKHQMAQAAYNAGIKFAIASLTDEKKVKTVNHISTTDTDRDLIICTCDVAYVLLKAEQKRAKANNSENKYWLFLDELTVGADEPNSESLLENMKVLQYAPKHTILSSATMCELVKFPAFTEHFTNLHPGSFIGTVYSKEVQIGCDVKTFDNERVLPHLGCITQDGLKSVVQSITENPFLGRLYTAPVALSLYKTCNELELEGTPDIKTIFSDVNNLQFDKVRQVCMQMLNLVSETSDEFVEKVCEVKISSTDESEIEFDMLGTTEAHRFMNGTLIVDKNPLEFAQTNFASLLQDMADSGIHSAEKLYQAYQTEQESSNKAVERLNKRVKNESKKSQEQQAIREQSSTIQFPERFQINTDAHIKKYTQRGVRINPSEIRLTYPLESIPFTECLVPDWVMLLLYAGVGIYSKSLNNEYNKTVLHMAAAGQLAYLLSDKWISYGTNYPIHKVIITAAFGEDNHNSINTLMQLLGRAGRVGKSYSAKAYISSKTALKLLQYVHDPSSEVANIEANNMDGLFQSLLVEPEEKTQQIPAQPTEQKIEVVTLYTREEQLAQKQHDRKHVKKDVIDIGEIKKKTPSPPISPASTRQREQIHDSWRNPEPAKKNKYIPPHKRKN